MKTADLNFVRSQGLADATSCDYQYPALMWQPRVIGVLVFLGLLLESGWYFVALGVMLWFSALLPRLNPFDAIYNRFLLKGRVPLGPARAPRRFSQGMAGTMMLVIGAAMIAGNTTLAWAFTGLLLLALALLIFGRFCLGSYIYHLITGKAALANRMLPWSRTE